MRLKNYCNLRIARSTMKTRSPKEKMGDYVLRSPSSEGADWRIINTYNEQFSTDASGNQVLVSYDADYFLVYANGYATEPGGPAFNDTLNDTAANDSILAGAGDDLIVGGGGNDFLWGDSSMACGSVKFGNGATCADLFGQSKRKRYEAANDSEQTTRPTRNAA